MIDGTCAFFQSKTMAKIKVLGSSSAGNCYILETDKEALILEAGINFNAVKKALNFDMSKIVGCLVSHCHGDHAGFVESFYKSGIRIFSHHSVLERHEKIKPLFVGLHLHKPYEIGAFEVRAIPVKHDVPCLCFWIKNKEFGNLVFATDMSTFGWRFGGLRHALIECNYDDETLQKNVLEGKVPSEQTHRIRNSHFSLSQVLDFADSHQDLQTLTLLHLSDRNSDGEKFQKTVQKRVFAPVFIAKKGLEIDLN